MTTPTAHRRRHAATFAALVLLTTGALAACKPAPTPTPSAAPAPAPAPPPGGSVSIMGNARLDAARLAAWFHNRQPQPGGTYAATVPVEMLAQYYVEEGAAEGVKGDIAFIQAIVETGWFRFGGSVPAANNNFAGIGATNTNPAPAVFPTARTGVRAQIQHLRAYADASATSCAIPPLHHGCADPRFALVTPKGKAPTWNQMGNGNWATSSTYASSILGLYNQALASR